jgi:hypothetical protein
MPDQEGTVQSFREFSHENGIDYFVIELTQELVPQAALINEGQWVPSGKSDWMQRVDAENPAIKQQRHVHVARAKHVSAKNMQVSWNVDGTKHDKKSFNSKIGSIDLVQSIARQTLGLSSEFKLEEAAKAPNLLVQINESMGLGITPVLFVLKRA